MDGLDFSGLTDDQLLELLRSALREAVSRNPAVARAAESLTLDEAERARIAATASANEAAAIRARDRERVAQEARARVRAEDEARKGAGERRAQAEQAAKAAQAVLQREAGRMEWLRRAAHLVERDPGEISLLHVETRYGRRVLINLGDDRYASDHLADYRVVPPTISTTKALVPRKKDILLMLAEFAVAQPCGTIILGSTFDWSTP